MIAFVGTAEGNTDPVGTFAYNDAGQVWRHDTQVWAVAPAAADAPTPYLIPATGDGTGAYYSDIPADVHRTELRVQGVLVSSSWILWHEFQNGAHETTVQEALDLAAADLYVDKTSSPWKMVWMKKGTGAPGVGVELQRKIIRDVDGSGLASTDTIVGQLTHTPSP
jgi:hypothetical protein